MLMAKRVTRQQDRLARARVKNPSATLVELGEKAGYSSASHVHRALQKPHVKDQIRELMNSNKNLRLGSLLKKLEEGLEATDLRSVRLEDSSLKAEVEIPDMAVRHKYLQDALKLHGALSNDEQQQNVGPINLAIILGGGGSELERQGVADVLTAARISRGLHPLENRRLTEKEAEQFRRSP